MSRSFAAAYPGTCAECDGPIEPGQSVCFTAVARRGGDLRHMACPDDGSELRAGESACPRCWLVHGESACPRCWLVHGESACPRCWLVHGGECDR